MDGPVVAAIAAPHDVARGQVHREIALELGVIEEVSLDDLALVAQGDRELLSRRVDPR
jgi:hypothetical protein